MCPHLVFRLALLFIHAITQTGSLISLLDAQADDFTNRPSGFVDDISVVGATRIGCPSCGNTGISRQMDRMDAIKSDILRKLRMLAPPNMTSYRQLPDIPSLHNMVRATNNSSKTLYQMRTASHGEDHVVNMTVIALSQPAGLHSNINLPNVIKFKINVDVDDVESANLSIFIRGTNDETFGTKYIHQRAPRRHVTLLLNKVFVSSDGQVKTSFYRRLRMQAPPRHGRWITLEVKSMFNDRQYVQQLMYMETVTLLMQIVLEETRHRTELLVTPGEPFDQPFKPFMELTVNEPSEVSDARRRRDSRFSSGSECDESTHESRCCRYPLSVDFAEIGWNWILAPKRFEAFYCSGICPFLFQQVDTVGHLRQQSSGTQHDGSPCCAPTKVSSLPLVYIDEGGGIVFGSLPGVVVERCGCA